MISLVPLRRVKLNLLNVSNYDKLLKEDGSTKKHMNKGSRDD